MILRFATRTEIRKLGFSPGPECGCGGLNRDFFPGQHGGVLHEVPQGINLEFFIRSARRQWAVVWNPAG